MNSWQFRYTCAYMCIYTYVFNVFGVGCGTLHGALRLVCFQNMCIYCIAATAGGSFVALEGLCATKNNVWYFHRNICCFRVCVCFVLSDFVSSRNLSEMFSNQLANMIECDFKNSQSRFFCSAVNLVLVTSLKILKLELFLLQNASSTGLSSATLWCLGLALLNKNNIVSASLAHKLLLLQLYGVGLISIAGCLNLFPAPQIPVPL